jgi:hypothetical protein
MVSATTPIRPGQVSSGPFPPVTCALLRLLDLRDRDAQLADDPEFLNLVEPEPRLPWKPTTAPAGSERKLRVFAERLARGESLFHPADSLERTGETSARGQGDVRGVCPFEGRWMARVTRNGKRLFLGLFVEREDAVAAVLAAQKDTKRGA